MAIRTERSAGAVSGGAASTGRLPTDTSVQILGASEADIEAAKKHLRGVRVLDGLVWGYTNAAGLKQLQQLDLTMKKEDVVFGAKQPPPAQFPAHAMLYMGGPMFEDWRKQLLDADVQVNFRVSDWLGSQNHYGDYAYDVLVKSRDAWNMLSDAEYTTGLRLWDESIDNGK